ncbi:MAG: ABC transporter permease, partial [Planctomycetaceae bacterium]|nr:ABC transporter permease [Planctomycetaceae bacterium]
MITGPLFVRELLIGPRHLKHFGLRAGYVFALGVLLYTGAQTAFGFAVPRSVGDMARLGAYLFNLTCYLQLTLVLATGLIFSAGSIAQEKDRRTLILLLMTDLRATELVIGKSLASLLPVFTVIAVSFPVLCLLRMLGGILLSQILWVEAICLATALVAGAWGSFVAYWREKTFQILSFSLLGAGLFIGVVETVSALAGPASTAGRFVGALDPYRALAEVLEPMALSASLSEPTISAWPSVLGLGVLALGLWGYTCWRVRVWNPSRTVYIQVEEHKEGAEAAAESQTASGRTVWERPILWREICTQAYGRKVGLIKAAYFLFAGFALLWLSRLPADSPLVFGMVSG